LTRGTFALDKSIEFERLALENALQIQHRSSLPTRSGNRRHHGLPWLGQMPPGWFQEPALKHPNKTPDLSTRRSDDYYDL